MSALPIFCVFSPDQSAVDLVLAPSHDLRPDIQQSALLGENEEFLGGLEVEGDARLFHQAQVTVNGQQST